MRGGEHVLRRKQKIRRGGDTSEGERKAEEGSFVAAIMRKAYGGEWRGD